MLVRILKSVCVRARFAIPLLVFTLSWMPLEGTRQDLFWWTDYLANILAMTALFVILGYLPATNKLLVFASKAIKKRYISNRQWLTISALVMLAVTILGSTYLFGRIPAIDDTYAQYLQAKFFASGHWHGTSHPLPRFFDMTFLVNDGKLYTQYPPGHSLILAIGMIVGAPWLVNPMLSALSVIAIYFLTREISNQSTARVASCLMLISPNIVFMGSEYMNHMTALLCTLCFVLFYIRSHRHERIISAIIAGNALGFLFITRPQVAIPLALPFAVHWVFTTFRSRPALFWAHGIATTVACGFWVGFFCYYNYQTTGDPFVTGYEKVGMGGWKPRANFFDPISLYYDYIRMVGQVQTLHIYMFAWCTSSLVFVWLLFQLRLTKPYCGLLISAILSITLSLMFTPYDGNVFRPRYLFEASGLCLVLTAVCLVRLPIWAKINLGMNLPLSHLRIISYLTVASLFLAAVPYRISDVAMFYKSNYYNEQNPDFYYKLLEVNKPALIFVGNDQKHWGPASLFNPPDDKSPIIVARHRGLENQQLIDMYPNRFVYDATGESISLYSLPKNVSKDAK